MGQPPPVDFWIVHLPCTAFEVKNLCTRTTNVPPSIGARIKPPLTISLGPQRLSVGPERRCELILAAARSLLMRGEDVHQCRGGRLLSTCNMTDVEDHHQPLAVSGPELHLGPVRKQVPAFHGLVVPH